MSRRAKQFHYVGAGVVILAGAMLQVVMRNDMGDLLSLTVLSIALCYAGVVIYVDINGHNRDGERRRTAEPDRRRAVEHEQTVASERARMAQQEAHRRAPGERLEHRLRPGERPRGRRPRRPG